MSAPSDEASDAAQGTAPERSAPARKRSRSFWQELPILVVIALVLALLIKTFLVQAFYIPSASMENTLQGGEYLNGVNVSTSAHPFDRILVNKLVYDFRSPRRGEIVVFSQPPGWPSESDSESTNPVLRFFHDVGKLVGVAPSSSSDFVKRVIGVGGDTVSCLHDVLRVNGHVLNEPFLYPGSNACSDDGFGGRTVHVPQGDLFVMGDHRGDSYDTRKYGYVPVSKVVGRAFVVIWPVKDWTTLPVPSTFHQSGLSAAADTMGGAAGAVPYAAGSALVLPVAGLRRRRRRRHRRATEQS